MDISQESKSPEAAFSTDGADTDPIVIGNPEVDTLLKTATRLSSIPLRLPSLSNKGTVMIILKLAVGAIVLCWLLFGSKYGSDGLTITELANTVAGGKAKTWYFVLSTKAVASVVRSVVMGVVMGHPIMLVGASACAINPRTLARSCALIR